MFVARFYWVSWSPPELTAEEEASIAHAIALSGKKTLVARFLGFASSGSAYGGWDRAHFLSVQGTGLFYLAFILFGALVWVAYGDAKQLPWWAEALVIVAAVSCLAAPIFYVSMIVATCRYALWLERIARRGGGRIETSRAASPLPPALPTNHPMAPASQEIMDADVARILSCSCGQRLRIPAFAGRVHLRCPSCNEEWDAIT